MTVTVIIIGFMTKPSKSNSKSPLVHLAQEVSVDLAATALIVAGLVFLLGEPLEAILTSPVFIVLVSAGLIHAGYKYFKRKKGANID
jgi:MFS-type transporter involved in bile tolerance (Atg22 family)